MKQILLLYTESNVVDAIRLMNDKNTSSIIVKFKDSEEPIGIVTERDILYCAVAESKGSVENHIKGNNEFTNPYDQ